MKWLSLSLAMILVFSAACAESLNIRDIAAGKTVTTEHNYITLDVPVSSAAPVTVTVTDKNGQAVWQRDYGTMSDSFRTEDIPLKLKGTSTSYNVKVDVGSKTYTVPVKRVSGKQSKQPACSVGYPLYDLTGHGDWQCATLLDISAMNGKTVKVPILAAGSYNAGTAEFSVSKGKLTVKLKLTDGSVDQAVVWVACDPAAVRSLGRKGFSGVKGKTDTAIDLHGARSCAVYLELSLSYDPTALSAAPDLWLNGQEEIWETMQQQVEAVG